MTSEDRRRGGDTLAQLIVEGYLTQLDGWAGDLHWTWSVVDDLVRDTPEIGWPLLLELIRRVPDGNLNTLAAGPLEDYLSQHGPRVIDAVEAEAATNGRLREALAMVRQLGMTNDVWHRVQSLADPRLLESLEREPPDGWQRRHLDAWFDGIPTFGAEPGSGGPHEHLVEALRDAKPDGAEPWTTPVDVEVQLLTGREPLSVPCVDVLAAVVELLESGGIIADRALVRSARVADQRSPTPLTHVTVIRMPDEQVAAIDSAQSFEEWMESDEMQALRAELEAARASGNAPA